MMKEMQRHEPVKRSDNFAITEYPQPKVVVQANATAIAKVVTPEQQQQQQQQVQWNQQLQKVAEFGKKHHGSLDNLPKELQAWLDQQKARMGILPTAQYQKLRNVMNLIPVEAPALVAQKGTETKKKETPAKLWRKQLDKLIRWTKQQHSSACLPDELREWLIQQDSHSQKLSPQQKDKLEAARKGIERKVWKDRLQQLRETQKKMPNDLYGWLDYQLDRMKKGLLKPDDKEELVTVLQERAARSTPPQQQPPDQKVVAAQPEPTPTNPLATTPKINNRRPISTGINKVGPTQCVPCKTSTRAAAPIPDTPMKTAVIEPTPSSPADDALNQLRNNYLLCTTTAKKPRTVVTPPVSSEEASNLFLLEDQQQQQEAAEEWKPVNLNVAALFQMASPPKRRKYKPVRLSKLSKTTPFSKNIRATIHLHDTSASNNNKRWRTEEGFSFAAACSTKLQQLQSRPFKKKKTTRVY